MATSQFEEYKGTKMTDDEDPDLVKEASHEVTTQPGTTTDIDTLYQRYPYCLVWTSIPFISWVLPMIGHVGICTSDGIIHDFAGSKTVNIDDLAYGDPLKYVQLDRSEIDVQQNWDECIKQGDEKYFAEEHNMIKNNCHSYVAYILNNMKYMGRSDWNPIGIWKLTVTKSKYINVKSLFKTYLGFLILVLLYAFLR